MSTKEYCKHHINWAFVLGVNLLLPTEILYTVIVLLLNRVFSLFFLFIHMDVGKLSVSFEYIRSDESSQDFWC